MAYLISSAAQRSWFCYWRNN